MFAFKARSISEYIANPISSSTTIPIDSVIFVTNNQMSAYSGSDNWSFINSSQSGGLPSYIRGVVNPANAGLLYTKNIGDSVTTISAGGHSGIESGTFSQPRNTGASVTSYGITNTNAGVHTHSISGLSGSNYLGGVFFQGTVVGMYRCISSTKEIPPKTIVLTSGNILNDDFSELSNVNNNTALLSGSSTWLSANGGNINDAISPTYGSPNPVSSFINFLTSSAGTHNHELTNVFSLYSRYYPNPPPQVRTPDELQINSPSHNHYATVNATIYPSIIYQKAHQTKRTTGVYRGIILGWLGNDPSTLPSGWYLCNGQTVNGIVTPSLNVNRYIMITNNSSYNGVQGGNDTANITVSTSAGSASSTHTHKPNTEGYQYKDTTYSAYHQIHDWIHSHDSITSTSINYRPGYYTMNFIIYLG